MKKDVAAAMSFHMVLRSRCKKQLKSIASLPEEILFNILLLLPADVLYAVMRFVSRQCYIIIKDPAFLNAHSLRPSGILLVQYSQSNARFLLVGDRDIKFSDVEFQFPGGVLSSCNGLTLVRDAKLCTTHRLYYIANPITNRMMTLPKFPWIAILVCSLVFAASSNTYKVVIRTYENIDNPPSYYGCAILTMGVDRAWRFLNCADILRDHFTLRDPVVSKEFLYWGRNYSINYMLAFNIESERFTTISLPEVHVDKGWRYFLPYRNTVSYIHNFGDFSISVWMLKDHETADWVKIPDFSVEVTVREAAQLVSAELLGSLNDCFLPLCWLDEEKLLFGIFRGSNIYFSYDIKTCATRIFEMEGHHRIFNHLNSLTSL